VFFVAYFEEYMENMERRSSIDGEVDAIAQSLADVVLFYAKTKKG